jgi:DeoR/GlpR family transcriptional regulator of sugar metabolism
MHVASIDRAAVDSAKRVMVLADHTKVGVDSMVQTVPTERIDTLVTDVHADRDELERLAAAGVQLRIAEPAEGFAGRISSAADATAP